MKFWHRQLTIRNTTISITRNEAVARLSTGRFGWAVIRFMAFTLGGGLYITLRVGQVYLNVDHLG